MGDGTWYVWTFLLPSTWLQLPWWKIVRYFKSALHSTRLYIAYKAQKLLAVSEVFWSFTFVFKSQLLCTQSLLTKSEGGNIKLRSYRESQNSNSGTSNVSSEKTPWLQTPMTRNSTAIMPVDIHKQAIKTKKIGKLNLKDKLSEQKQREAPWDFVYTPSIEHWFIQTSFYCGFDRYKVKDCFRVQLVNWRLLLFH